MVWPRAAVESAQIAPKAKPNSSGHGYPHFAVCRALLPTRKSCKTHSFGVGDERLFDTDEYFVDNSMPTALVSVVIPSPDRTPPVRRLKTIKFL